MAEVLDGGCILYQLRPKAAPAPLRVRRAMTEEELAFARAFGGHPTLHRNDLAMAMFNYASEGWKITERQSAAIYAIARKYGIAPLRSYVAADILALKAEIAKLQDVFPPEGRERLERIIRLLELGIERVGCHPRGLLIGGRLLVGPKCWRFVEGGKWQPYKSLEAVLHLYDVVAGNAARLSRSEGRGSWPVNPQRGSPTSITPIVAGKQCIGFVFPRGRVGFEAFDEEKSLGLYQTRESAIAAVIDAQRAA